MSHERARSGCAGIAVTRIVIAELGFADEEIDDLVGFTGHVHRVKFQSVEDDSDW